eukprot:TRINITY_DN29656_c0_g1_i2.p1 TRINITY_DN29656_c0_g1~~TRINITY_DN29656_c0_g1_i2.p1  ORF type:complete len:150 (+),score=53.26 TRINITY_DN29656_c0_g1_i2:115-564(+)
MSFGWGQTPAEPSLEPVSDVPAQQSQLQRMEATKARANELYKNGELEQALGLYREGLGLAVEGSEETAELVGALHLNSALMLQKMGLHEEALVHCSSAMSFPKHQNKAFFRQGQAPVSYTHLRAHETPEHLVCRLLLEKKKKNQLTLQA